MKLTSALSFILATATVLNAFPLEGTSDATTDLAERSAMDTTLDAPADIQALTERDAEELEYGSFDVDEDDVEDDDPDAPVKRALGHIILHNNSGGPLHFNYRDGVRTGTLQPRGTTTFAYPPLNAAGYRVALSRPSNTGKFFLAEFEADTKQGSPKINYNFSVAGNAVDPFKGLPKSFYPTTNRNKPGYRCENIFCKKGSDQCAAPNGSFVYSCPAATNLAVFIGPRT